MSRNTSQRVAVGGFLAASLLLILAPVAHETVEVSATYPALTCN